LQEEADRYPSQISGGQAQRCALARALAPHPEVLLLDEPLSALDVLVRTRLREEIRRIQQQVGTTTIHVTHDQAEALVIADRVVVMNRGRIEQVGAPRDVYAAPRSRFTASFVGNRNAVVIEVREGRVALGGLIEMPAPAGADGTVVAYFAPENLGVDLAPGGQPATIESIGFHGALTRLRVRLEVGDESLGLYADLPSRSAGRFEIGQQVGLRLDAADVRCFPRERLETI
jgi:putative spermidine/putrescine transport system ATP-binding protein